MAPVPRTPTRMAMDGAIGPPVGGPQKNLAESCSGPLLLPPGRRPGGERGAAPSVLGRGNRCHGPSQGIRPVVLEGGMSLRAATLARIIYHRQASRVKFPDGVDMPRPSLDGTTCPRSPMTFQVVDGLPGLRAGTWNECPCRGNKRKFDTPAFRLTHQSRFFIHPSMLITQIVPATPFAISPPYPPFPLPPSRFLSKCESLGNSRKSTFLLRVEPPPSAATLFPSGSSNVRRCQRTSLSAIHQSDG